MNLEVWAFELASLCGKGRKDIGKFAEYHSIDFPFLQRPFPITLSQLLAECKNPHLEPAFEGTVQS